MRIGVLSDTHGLLRPKALAWLEGSDCIVHAGDICESSALDCLRKIAPVIAVRGNNDRGPWAQALRLTEMKKLGGACIYVIHDLSEMDIDPQAAAINVVISGHTHSPLAVHRAGVLYLNPGSCGPRRFRLPIAAAELIVDGTGIRANIAHFDD